MTGEGTGREPVERGDTTALPLSYRPRPDGSRTHNLSFERGSNPVLRTGRSPRPSFSFFAPPGPSGRDRVAGSSLPSGSNRATPDHEPGRALCSAASTDPRRADEGNRTPYALCGDVDVVRECERPPSPVREAALALRRWAQALGGASRTAVLPNCSSWTRRHIPCARATTAGSDRCGSAACLRLIGDSRVGGVLPWCWSPR